MTAPIRSEIAPELEYVLARDLHWQRDGADWVLFNKRRRMGRVIPDGDHRAMYRVALSRGRVSDLANLSWTKDAVTAAAVRELAYERRATDLQKAQQNRGSFPATSPPVRYFEPGVTSHSSAAA
jgi:hypothetical protein